ncbi:MAG TPA: hypothetical protein VHQ65_04190 [Thermoanaerobaculia bacterium]|nr:hypothetical protein [Thermoanaerobaculia bacterium]
MKSTVALGLVLTLAVAISPGAAAQVAGTPVEKEDGSLPEQPAVEPVGHEAPEGQRPEGDPAEGDPQEPSTPDQPPIFAEAADPAESGDPPEAAEQDTPAAETTESVEAAPSPAEPPRPPRYDVCDVTSPDGEATLDRVRREMFESVCKSAQWFDGFFGNRRFDEEARQTHGRAQLRMVWDEHDELEVDGRFKVRFDLPNLDHRVNAFFGREDEEDFVSGVDEGITFLPDFFRQEGREEWILGLGYRPVGSDRSQTDFDVGVDVDTPLEPFARGRYRRYWLFGDRNLLRAQETLYWTSQRGFGSTTHLDVERPVGQRALVRWNGRGTVDQEAEGLDWYTGLTLYHGFGPDQAVALTLGADGETDDEVPLHEYGARVTYRRRMLREWFFGELIGGVSWPRDDLLEQRETALHFGFGFEIQFSGEDLGVGQRRPPRRPAPGQAPDSTQAP